MPSKHRKLVLTELLLHTTPCVDCLIEFSHQLLEETIISPVSPNLAEFLKFLKILQWLPRTCMKSRLLPIPPFQPMPLSDLASPLMDRTCYSYWLSRGRQYFPSPIHLLPLFLRPSSSPASPQRRARTRGGK